MKGTLRVVSPRWVESVSQDTVEGDARAVPMDSTVPAVVAERLRASADRPPRGVLDVGYSAA